MKMESRNPLSLAYWMIALAGGLLVMIGYALVVPLFGGGILAYLESHPSLVPFLVLAYAVSPMVVFACGNVIWTALAGHPAYRVVATRLVYLHPLLFSVALSAIKNIRVTRSSYLGLPARFVEMSLLSGKTRRLRATALIGSDKDIERELKALISTDSQEVSAEHPAT